VTVTIRETELDGLSLFRRGKVRDTYDLGDRLLMVATDRISAFDVVLPTAIPRKGVVLTQLSRYWFDLTRSFAPNHLIEVGFSQFPEELRGFGDRIDGRAMIVRKAERIDIECVVRGYVAGSAWAEYRRDGTIAGMSIEQDLRQSQQLAEPLFTPAVKNEAGHDMNISVAELRNRVGGDLASQLEKLSKLLYGFAADAALRRGIIIADTKFEFGFVDGVLTVIDEILTPDSSRFWDAALYQPGRDQASFDKQFVRDWLEGTGWNKQSPGPELPDDVVTGTASRYHEAYKRLTGRPLWFQLEQR
jgi:phosphoribosylaminoimidazole-succinocarboxamide synthase